MLSNHNIPAVSSLLFHQCGVCSLRGCRPTRSAPLRLFCFCPHAGSVERSPLIGQFAAHAKHNRLENVRLISQDESEKADPERLSEADHWETCGGQTELWCRLQRCSGLSGWLHEHRHRADRGVCQWTAEEQVWGCLSKRKQCSLHQHPEEESVVKIVLCFLFFLFTFFCDSCFRGQLS